jgi:hypothetical protein
MALRLIGAIEEAFVMSTRPILIALSLAGALLLAGSVVVAAPDPIERLDRWFVFGTNLAWFNNNYGCDLGVNHAEGGWQPTFTAEQCDKVFANLARMGCPVVRIWAFERQEGLLFTPDLTTDPRYPYHEVVGLDPVFLANCRTLMDIAARHRVMVYWSLLNHLIREEQGGRHMRIITDPKVRASYIEKAAVPFLKEFASHPAFFAVDIINEADGAVGGLDFLSGGMDPRKGCSWKEMRAFIKACADAFHAAVPGIKVTATSGWHEENNLKAGRFSGLGLDFYDWHSYRDDPVLPHARSLNLDRPVIIGECGPRPGKSDGGSYARQGENWRAYLREARKGYAGLLTWSYGNPGADDLHVMVNADHSWRDGAKMIHDSTRGLAIPDAGPLLLSPAEKAEREAIHAAMRPLLAIGADALLTGRGTPLGPRLRWLVAESAQYFPYLNLRYARISLNRAATEVAGLGAWAHGTGRQAELVARLQSLGRAMLAPLAGVARLHKLDGVARLRAFVALDPAGPAKPSVSPFDGDFTPVRLTP